MATIEKTGTIIRKKKLNNGAKMNYLNKLRRAAYLIGNSVIFSGYPAFY